MLGCFGQQVGLFAYPVAPESMPLGRPRANYIVEHFWEAMPWKKAHTMPARMERTLRDFAGMLPLASPDTVHRSVGKLIEGARKKTECFEALIPMAEATFHSDTALLFSDEVYLPFAEAASQFKKFPQAERRRYGLQAQVIRSTSVGAELPPIKATRRDGTEFALNDTATRASSYVIIIEQPGSERFDRVSFAANYAVNSLINSGLLKPVLIYAGTAPDEWWKTTEGLSSSWSVGELPDASQWFDLRVSPAVYVLSSEMNVAAKWMPVPSLIANCESLLKRANQTVDEK